MIDRTSFLVRVSDIKQWFYCPRVVYFTYLMPVQKKITAKMQFGAEEHEVISKLERRRKLRRYGIGEGQRLFHVPLVSEKLGLTGVLDLLLRSSGEYYPVEFKDTTRGVSQNHKYQLTGYALLVEEKYACQVNLGFVYQIPIDRVSSVRIDQKSKDVVTRAVADIRAMIRKETMPDATPQRGRCTDCEFVHFCGDRW